MNVLVSNHPAAQVPATPLARIGGVDTARVFESTGEASYFWDLITDHLQWWGDASGVLSIKDSAALGSGHGYAARLAPEATLSRYAAVQNSAARDSGDGVAFRVVYRMIADDGQPMWVEDIGKWFSGPDGRPAEVRGAIRVVTDQHEESRRLAEAKRIDPLTGALTRLALLEHLSRLLVDRAKQPGSFAVLLAAIDSLAAVNSDHGYSVGDSLIAGVARCMREHMRSNDVIARYTGNRLALVLDACDAERLPRAAERHIEIIASVSIKTAAGALGASMRIGAVLQPVLSRGPEPLLRQAEEALDHARNDDRRFAVYTSGAAPRKSPVRKLESHRR